MNFKAIQNKQQHLENIKQQLKTEFYGIDGVIDEILNTLQPWYLFNEAQTHPLIINLWGLTGTGKTSLVNRLVNLLKKEQAYFRFEMSDHKNKDVNRQLSNALELYEDEDYILCFDEFQHIRTKDEAGHEVDNDLGFNLWDLLDNGEFDRCTNLRDQNTYLNWYEGLKMWIKLGFRLRDGLIYFDEQPAELQTYLKKFYQVSGDRPKEYMDRLERHYLFRLFEDRFDTIIDFEKYYEKAKVEDLLKLLYEASKRKRKTEKGDLSHALIFVVGNLDEAYDMSQDYNPDINADAFYQQSLDIKIPQIKEALKERFRHEQIARLGNNHIIYPALNQSAYRRIISYYLEKLATHFESLYHIKIKFNQKLVDMLYENGVYPTQGVRPLLSSLMTHIDANMGKIFSQLAILNLDADLINISYQNEALLIEYQHSKKLIETFKIPIDTPLDKIRQNIDINRQTVTAVHEAGHAVLSIALLYQIPSQINSTTADSNTEGFTYNGIAQKLITKKDLLHMTARFLGGLEAERLVFGDELISLGSRSDLKTATQIISKALTENGMGSRTGHYSMKSVYNKHSLSEALPELEIEIETFLDKAKQLANQILKQEQTLLLKIAQYLTKHRNMTLFEIEDFIKVYASKIDIETLKGKQSQQPHVDCLQEKLNNIPTEQLQVDERLVRNLRVFLGRN